MTIIETIGVKLKGQIDIFISLGSFSTKSNKEEIGGRNIVLRQVGITYRSTL